MIPITPASKNRHTGTRATAPQRDTELHLKHNMNTTEHSEPLGEPILLFPLRKDKEGKGFLAHPDFHSLSMKGYSYDGNQSATLCSTHQRFS